MYHSLHIYVPIISLVQRAKMTDDYIGCFEDSGGDDRVLNGKEKDLDPNGRQRCKQYCSEQGFRYAGTESGEECFCGNSIRRRKPADGCNFNCEGNHAEKCGGHWKISIYDTWHCISGPCKNGATCTDINATTYTCHCSQEWTGELCDQENTTTPLPTTTTTSKTTTILSTLSTTTRPVPTTVNNATTEGHDSNHPNHLTDLSLTTTDDPSSLNIAMYVLLPLAAIVIMVLIGVVLKRRRRRKTESIPESVNLESVQVPDIYVNSTTHQGADDTDYGQHCKGKQGNKMTRDELDTEKGTTTGQHAEEYNTCTTALRQNNVVFDNSYDHVGARGNILDKTYSKTNTNHLNNNNVEASNTYSTVDNFLGQTNANAGDTMTVNVYNTLDLGVNRQPNRNCDRVEDISVYNHTGTEQLQVRPTSVRNGDRDQNFSFYDHTDTGQLRVNPTSVSGVYDHTDTKLIGSSDRYGYSKIACLPVQIYGTEQKSTTENIYYNET